MFLFASILCFSQDSSFQLKDYKYRTPGFRALSVNLSLSGSSNNSKSTSSGENSNKNLSWSTTNLYYTNTVSTDKRLHESSIYLQPWGDVSKQTIGNQEKKNNTFSNSFKWQRNDRLYKNSLWFFEYGNNLELTLNNNSFKEQGTHTIQNIEGVKNTIAFGVGKGRIERVQDAQMAMYILNDLKTQGLLDVAVTPELTNSFAQLITSLNNRRVFDTRRRRIYEFTKIDSFLRASGAVNNTDIRHFTTVNDNWAYAFNPYRLAGFAWFVRLKPGIEYSKTLSQTSFVPLTKFSTQRFSAFITPQVGVEKYVPINLKWQQNMGASVSLQVGTGQYKNKNISSTGTSITKGKGNGWQTGLNAFYGVAFFPNTRTQIGANAEADALYYDNKTSTLSSSLRVFMNYFIGYRTYFIANTNLSYNNLHYPLVSNSNRFDVNINLTFQHILF